MTQKFRFSRLMMGLVFLVASMLVFVACSEQSVEDKLNEVKDQLQIQFEGDETAESIMNDLVFPTLGAHDAVVTWSSNNTAVIQNDGTVNRPAPGQPDATVTITATVTIGNQSTTRVFTVTVLAEEGDPQDFVDSAVAVLEDLFENINEVDSDLTLPTTGANGVVITWQSSNPDLIATDGTVTRPQYFEGNSTVILTAVVSFGDVEEELFFAVTVLANVKTDLNQLEEVYETLFFAHDQLNFLTTYVRLSETGAGGVTISWASSDEEIIEIKYIEIRINNEPVTILAGVAIRPDAGEDNATATLTATLTLNDATLEKVFNFTVIAEELFEFGPEAVSIADVYDSFLPTQRVSLMGVTVVGNMTIQNVSGTGFFVTDGEDIMFIHTAFVPAASRPMPEPGSVINVDGVISNYFGSLQIGGSNLYVEASAEAARPIEPTVKSLADIIAELNVNKTEEVNNFYNYYRVNARVLVEGTGLYNTFLVPLDFEGTLQLPNFNYAIDNVLLVYYVSNIDSIRLFNGLEVTLDVIIQGNRDDRGGIWSASFVHTTGDIEVTLDDELRLELIEQSLEFPEMINAPTTLDLWEEHPYFGGSIAWTSSHPELISTDGVVTLPATSNELVTLTATITVGSLEAIVHFEILVGELDVITIQQAQTLPNGQMFRIQGIITAILPGTHSVYLQDETGGFYVFTPPQAIRPSLVIGNEVILEGERATFNQGPQMIDAALIEVVSTGNVVEPLLLETFDSSLLGHFGKLVSVEGFYIKTLPNITGTGGVSITLADLEGNEIVLRLDSEFSLSKPVRDLIVTLLNDLEVGQYINVNGAPLTRFNTTPQMMVTNVNQLEVVAMSYEDKAAMVEMLAINLESGMEVINNLILPTSGFFGSTIEWTSSDSEVISTTGTVVRPEAGQPNAIVTLTYTIKIGEDDTFTGDIEITVLALSAAEPIYSLIFETGFETTDTSNKTGYATGNITSSEREFILHNGVVGNIAGDAKVGERSLRIGTNSNNGAPGYLQNLVGIENLGRVEFLAASYGSDSNISFRFLISIDGENWIQVGSNESVVAALAPFSFTINYEEPALVAAGFEPGTPIFFRIENTSEIVSANTRRLNVDELKLFDVTIPEDENGDELTLAYSFNFTGSTKDDGDGGASTGYAAGVFRITNLVDQTTFSAPSVETQVTTSSFEPLSLHGNFLVMRSRVSDSTVLFDFEEEISKIELSVAIWSPADLGRIEQMTNFELQVWNEVTEDWEVVLDILPIIDQANFIFELSVEELSGSKFRLFGSQDGTGDVRFAIVEFNAYTK